MDMEWGSPAAGKFLTNVGLISSNGPHGYNIMAAEWTHHISYEPGLIMVNIHDVDATAENISNSKEFGVCLAAEDQNVISSIVGNSTGKEVDKIAVLKEFGVELYKAKNIDVMMVKGAALHIECRVVEQKKVGDHTMFIGEVVNFELGEKEPIIYHGGKYYKLGERVHKPGQEVLDRIEELVKKHAK